ncbi:hypothetical protein ES703_99233 [subsurface metagenome]
MTEVTEVADLYPVYLKAEDGVAAPLCPGAIIMVGRDALELYPFNLSAIADYLRVAPDGGYVVMVKVGVTHGNDIRRFFYLAVGQSFVGSIRVGDYLDSGI